MVQMWGQSLRVVTELLEVGGGWGHHPGVLMAGVALFREHAPCLTVSSAGLAGSRACPVNLCPGLVIAL